MEPMARKTLTEDPVNERGQIYFYCSNFDPSHNRSKVVRIEAYLPSGISTNNPQIRHLTATLTFFKTKKNRPKRPVF
ncbi:hypothetical protein [Pseudomonas akapageensis]|uniref:hypothetical protein n=1 Tax=Pseudomonas akapageensis TaxID=2609961 RepID=UPI00140A09E4|nr:hypothetical protein [Pseudomonas akapageensis]